MNSRALIGERVSDLADQSDAAADLLILEHKVGIRVGTRSSEPHVQIIQKHYRRRFLPLGSSEVMLENSFTFPAYRGRGLMPFATWQLLNKARELGYRRAVTYIRKEKIDPLNQFLRMGFSIKKIVREYKLLGYARRSL